MPKKIKKVKKVSKPTKKVKSAEKVKVKPRFYRGVENNTQNRASGGRQNRA